MWFTSLSARTPRGPTPHSHTAQTVTPGSFLRLLSISCRCTGHSTDWRPGPALHRSCPSCLSPLLLPHVKGAPNSILFWNTLLSHYVSVPSLYRHQIQNFSKMLFLKITTHRILHKFYFLILLILLSCSLLLTFPVLCDYSVLLTANFLKSLVYIFWYLSISYEKYSLSWIPLLILL